MLDGVDLELAAGESVAVMGPSGSGKTSLLHCFAGLVVAAAGEVDVAGHPLHRMSRRDRARMRLDHVGMVFQFGELLEELSVAENVGLPLRLRGERLERVRPVLDAVGLADRASSWPAELSGGEVQRVAIARAVAGSPTILLADEPTGALDEERSAAVCSLLRRSAADVGAALVVATHDPAVAATLDRVVRLRAGRLVDA